MLATIIVGSGHPESTCFKIGELIKEQLDSEQIKVELFDVVSLSIKECLGCDYCKAHQNHCIIDDFMTQELYPILNKSDYLIFVSPVYFSNIPAELKKVIDRFQLYFNLKDKQMVKPKKFIAIHIGGAPKYTDQFEAFKNTYRVLLPDINAQMFDFIGISNSDHSDPLTDEDVLNQIRSGVTNLIKF